MGIVLRGKCSWFGGPNDMGVKRNEGLALVSKSDLDKFDGYFLDRNPPKTTGLARRLNPTSYYIACRWNYKSTSREYLQGITVSVRNPNKPGAFLQARPVDWGPNVKTGRVADLSPGLMKALDLETNGIVEVNILLPGESKDKTSIIPKVPVIENVLMESRPISLALPILTKQIWPLQRDCDSFYGNPRLKGFVQNHLIEVPVPWKMIYETTAVTHILINRRCSESLERVLAYIWAACGQDQTKIDALRYNRFSGSYNYRPMRGGGALSMHAYGAALDFDDEDNPFHSKEHLFTESSLIVKAFESEAWIWGGSWASQSIDAMHFQAARIHGG